MGKAYANLAKIYDEKIKYSGHTYEVLDRKLAIFRDTYRRVRIPPSLYEGALPTILKGRAVDFYYSQIVLSAPLTFDQMVSRLRA